MDIVFLFITSAVVDLFSITSNSILDIRYISFILLILTIVLYSYADDQISMHF